MLSDSEACASGITCFLREMNPLSGFPSGRVRLQWYSLLRFLVEKLFINLLVFLGTRHGWNTLLIGRFIDGIRIKTQDDQHLSFVWRIAIY